MGTQLTVTVTPPRQIIVEASGENAYVISVSNTSEEIIISQSGVPGQKGDQGIPGVGVPAGGNTGQQLTKISDVSYDTVWADPQYPVGADKQLQYNDGGVLGADTSLRWNKNSKTLALGLPEILPDNPLAMGGSLDGWLQANINNTGELPEASCDWVATADNGNDSTNYADIGIDSSIYESASYPAYGPNDGYFQVEGERMLLNTLREDSPIVFITGGAETTNIRGKIDAEGITLTAGHTYKIGEVEMATVKNRPEIFYGTGSPPSAVGLADGTMFFKYA